MLSKVTEAGRGASPLTDDCEGACGLCRAEGVGDLTNVGAAVLGPQVTDGQPHDVLGPAAISWKGSAILEPADGRDGVAGGGAGQLHVEAGPHFLGVEAVQDGGDRLGRVWKAENTRGPGQPWVGAGRQAPRTCCPLVPGVNDTQCARLSVSPCAPDSGPNAPTRARRRP